MGKLKVHDNQGPVEQVHTQTKIFFYYYRGDDNIPIGVLGMVDDTLSFSKCGNSSVKKNAVINSFVETQRLTLSKTKSVALHIGRKTKC